MCWWLTCWLHCFASWQLGILKVVSEKESRWAGVGLARLCHGDRDGSCLHCCHVELLLFLQNTVFERSHDIMVEFSPPEALFFWGFFKIFFVNLNKKLNIRIWLTPQCSSVIGNLSLKSCTMCLRELQFKVKCIGLRFGKEFSIVKVMAIRRRRWDTASVLCIGGGGLWFDHKWFVVDAC